MKSVKSQRTLAILLGSTCLLSIGVSAQAQTDATPRADEPVPTAQDVPDTVEEIIVTGYRRSLQNAAASKRQSTNFTEAVFAEDIGKFPDLNLAESLQRVPGVQISRDGQTGEGTQVRVRGLGPSFTRILLNGNPINPATDGGTDDNSNGREVDLNLFPSELFTKLEISKTPIASQLEGGLSVVNLRPAHAFDNEGTHGYFATNGSYSTTAEDFGYGGSFVVSKTWDKFGILLGGVANRRVFSNTGYWSSGWTNANLACAGCDNTQSNLFTFATTVPVNTGNGLVTGTPITVGTLLALNPGVTANQLTNGYLPRADRHELLEGATERGSALLSMEWRPTDDLSLALDVVGNKTSNVFDRYNSNWYVRSSSPAATGGMVPIGLTIDSNNVVTGGRFANSNFFVTQRHMVEDSYFYQVNPTLAWNVTDQLKLSLSAYVGEGEQKRSAPTLWITTRLNQGINATYAYNPGDDATTVSFDFDVADPTSGIWTWENESVQREVRNTESDGVHTDLAFELNSDHSFGFGVAYDRSFRGIRSYSQDVTAALRTQIPQAQIASYLTTVTPASLPNQGYQTFVAVNRGALLAATNLEALEASAPLVQRTILGTSIGDVEEKTTGAYLTYAGRYDLFDRDLRVNGGVRYVTTDQLVNGPVTLGGVLQFQEVSSSYDAWLPTLNVAFNATDKLVLRAAASRTMTRASPQDILPGTNVTDSAGQAARTGNPDLEPYFSDNYDIGAEYYFGGSGYVALGLFQKNVEGFTTVINTNGVFSDLGVDINSLYSYQRDAIIANGGANAPVVITRPVNTDTVKLKGLEATWVQPLDFIMDGIGFNASATFVEDGDTTIPTGISPRIYNLIGYYDSEAFSFRVSWVYQAAQLIAAAPQYSYTNGTLKLEERSQVDVSAGYNFTVGQRDVRLSLDATNIFEEETKQVFVDGDVTLPLKTLFSGAQYRLELSARF